MKNQGTVAAIVLYTVFYFTLCLLFTGSGYTNEYYVLVSIATFLYGIFIAFSIYNHQIRAGRLKELLRTDDAYLLSLYRQSKLFGKETQNEVRSLIDAYLITQINYKLSDDYHQSTLEFEKLYSFILDLHPANDRQLAAYQSMISILTTSSIDRKLVGSYARQKMTKIEWLSICSLHTLIAIFVFAFHGASIISSILSTVLVVAGFIMILVLEQLNRLTWQEEDWLWHPLHNLFLDLSLIPYYPEMVLSQKRAIVPTGSTVRVCHYGKPYPDMTGNDISTVVLGR